MSKVPALIDALVAALRATPELSAVEVADGPVRTDSVAPDWVFVGYDGDPTGEGEAAVVEQNWLSLGADRGEQIALTLTIVASRGENEVKPARDRVYEIAAPVRDLLRADPTLGVPQTQAAVGSTRLLQPQTTTGVQARLEISLVYRTLG